MRKRRKILAWLNILFLVAALVGCGGNARKMSEDVAMVETAAVKSVSTQDNGGLYESEKGQYDMAAGQIEGKEESVWQENSNRKLIRTVSMDVETEDFDGLMEKLENRVKELKGYIENSNIRGNARYDESRRSSMTIRIPSSELDNFVNEVAEISNITRKSESVEDITLNYVDVESRKKALEIEQERLLALLEKAESVEDIISVESRLSEVRYELQSYASRLLVYDNQVEYSTINLNVNEVKRLTPQEEPTIWERIATGFVDNLEGALKLLENIAVGVLVLIPYWGIFVLMIVLAVVVCKAIYKMQKGKEVKKKIVEEKPASEEKSE